MDVEYDNDINSISTLDTINNYFARKKEKKRIKDPDFLSIKPRNVHQKSERNKLIQKMLALKTDKKEFIDEFLAKNGIKVSEEQKKHFYAINKLRSDFNKKITIPKSLIVNKIFIYYKISNVQYSFISNDLLTNIALFYVSNQNWQKLGFEQSITLNNAFLCSKKTYNLENAETKFKECYIEDMNSNISFIGFDTDNVTKEEIDKFINEATNKQKFTYGGSNYVLYAKDTRLLIYKTSEFKDNETIANAIRKTTLIYKDKGNLKRGFKTINKKDGLFFFQQNLNLTDFCPSIVITDEPSTYDVLYKIEVNPEDLLNYYISRNNNEDIIVYNNLINFENLDDMISFFTILSFTSDVNDNVKNLINNYNNSRKVIALFKKEYNDFKTIVLSFYDSFMYKLNLDTIMRIHNQCNDFINQNNIIAKYGNDESYNKFIYGLQNYGTTLFNYLQYKKVDFINVIYNICSEIINSNGQIADLSEQVRTIGVAIYDMFFNNKTNILNTIRSPFSFLSNIVGNSKMDILRNNLNNLLREYFKKDQGNVIKYIERQEGKNDGVNGAEFIHNAYETLGKYCDNYTNNDVVSNLNPNNIIPGINTLINNYNNLRKKYNKYDYYDEINPLVQPTQNAIDDAWNTCTTYVSTNNTVYKDYFDQKYKNDFNNFAAAMIMLANMYYIKNKLKANEHNYMVGNMLQDLILQPTTRLLYLFSEYLKNKDMKIKPTLDSYKDYASYLNQDYVKDNKEQEFDKKKTELINNRPNKLLQMRRQKEEVEVKKGRRDNDRGYVPKKKEEQGSRRERDRSKSKPKDVKTKKPFKVTKTKDIEIKEEEIE